MSSTRAGTLIGYARAADERSVQTQAHALTNAGCARIFQQLSVGLTSHSPELDACLDYLRPADALIVWRLDRLARSLPRLVELIEHLHDRRIGFRSLVEHIDTTAPEGERQLKLFRALADSERALHQERTRGGLAAAGARGRKSGRLATLTPEKLNLARKMLHENQHTVPEIATALGVSRATLYRHIATKRREHERHPHATASQNERHTASARAGTRRAASPSAPAPARDRKDGRSAVLTLEKLEVARQMRAQKHTMPEIAKVLGVSRATLYRHMPPTHHSREPNTATSLGANEQHTAVAGPQAPAPRRSARATSRDDPPIRARP